MKKLISLILALLLVLPGVPALADGIPTLVFSSAEADAAGGGEVSLTLSIRNNPGLLGLSTVLDYDPAVLTLVGVTPLIDSGTWMLDNVNVAEDHILFWYGSTVYSGEAIASVTFRVAEAAPAGPAQVGLSFGEWDGIYDSNGEDLTDYRVSPGSVSVTKSTFTLRFDPNGGENAPEALSTAVGGTLTLPDAVPTRDGWLFLGWSDRADAEDAQYSAGAAFTPGGDTTLYAVWLELSEPDFRLPASLQSLGDEAFAGTAVRYAALPAGLTELGNRVFSGCKRLVAVFAPALDTDILPEAFDGAPAVLTLLGTLGSAIASFAAAHGLCFQAVANPFGSPLS